MTVRLDHVVILVDDLAAASADFTTLGFHVSAGGTHAGGLTHNALIGFADGAYLELLAFTEAGAAVLARGLEAPGAMSRVLRGRTALDRRFLPRAAGGEGCIDWAVARDDLAELVGQPGHGTWLTGPFPGERIRPDGVRLRWELVIPADPVSPFLVRDHTPRALRVPAETNHRNAATGIGALTVACPDLHVARRAYSTLLSCEPASAGPEVEYRLQDVRVVLRPSGPSPSGVVSLGLAGWTAARHPAITTHGVHLAGSRRR